MIPDVALSIEKKSRHSIATLAVVFILYIVQAIIFYYAMIVVDSGRDIANAWTIASAQGFPLYGPEIYGTWHLGPFWFYFLALPLALGGSLGTLALCVGLLAAAKVPLAYLLGKHWYGSHGGLLLAALISIPGWSSVGSIAIAHTSIVESAVLLVMLLSLSVMKTPCPKRSAILMLAFALALHAHPTAIVITPWVAVALVYTIRQSNVVTTLLLSAAAFSLPWLPLLIAEASSGWLMLSTSGDYFEGLSLAAMAPGNTYAVAKGLLIGWVPFVSQYMVPWLSDFESIMVAGALLILCAATLGLIRSAWGGERLTLAIIVNLVGALWLLSVLRPDAVAHMYFALIPLVVCALGIGLTRLLAGRTLTVGWILVVLSIVLQIGVLIERRSIAENGSLWSYPGDAAANISQPVEDDGVVLFWLAAGVQDQLAAELCGSNTSLHGELASAFSWGAGVAIERACRDHRFRPHMGGKQGDRRIAGIPRAHAEHLGIEDGEVKHGFTLLDPRQVLHPEFGEMIVANPEYPVVSYRERLRRTGAQSTEINAACQAGELLVVNNLMPALNPMSLQVSDSISLQEAALETLASSYFRCTQSSSMRIRIEALNLEQVEIFTL